MILTEALKKKNSNEWLPAFEAIGIPCGPLNSIPDVAIDPQILHREMFVELDDTKIGKVKVCNTPVKLSRTPTKPEKPAALSMNFCSTSQLSVSSTGFQRVSTRKNSFSRVH